MGADGTIWCPLSAKKVRKADRISLECIIVLTDFLVKIVKKH